MLLQTDIAGGVPAIKKPFVNTIAISILDLRLRHASLAAKWPIVIVIRQV